MRTDFSVFRERLVEACRVRGVSEHQLYRSIGLSGRRAVDFELFGLKGIDIQRLGQIADRLDVSIDWLLGRTTVMEVSALPEPPKQKAKKTA